MSRGAEEIPAVLARESVCLGRLEAILREEEDRLDSAATDPAAERERTALLSELATLRGVLRAALPAASAHERRLARENEERARALEGRTRELSGRYAARREDLAAALAVTRRARAQVAELTGRPGGARIDLKR